MGSRYILSCRRAAKGETLEEAKESLRSCLNMHPGMEPKIWHGDLGVFNADTVREALLDLGICPSAPDITRGAHTNQVVERFHKTLKETLLPKLAEIHSEHFPEISLELLGDVDVAVCLLISFYNNIRINPLFNQSPRNAYYTLLGISQKELAS